MISILFLAAVTTLVTWDFLYGLTVGIFMTCWFFGAAILGDLSNTLGRKNALLLCLIGSFLDYLLSAFAVGIYSLTFLILG
ncbi:sugar porter family MFS transporter [Coxiella endosymbiont of Ornithodoros amblus]|uniref:MFS transporter n=1 Tax=Coxiella endosymbiont of Ornithodoros amblus TaxID=1656166 RepID=UPI00244DA5C6|nr:MFS transporter [Coxiella endosymbiont of Ornithodoros amblus]MBW5803107.1 sugar porter family MFS transporter [Coxiella endosymbiont of Ornithodoros amblus]